jgi:hypothetical protein
VPTVYVASSISFFCALIYCVHHVQHIYLENVCKKSFSYPRDDRDNDATQADFPGSSDEDETVVEIQTVTVIPLPAASASAAVA